jgi:hypothetical protein
LLGSLEAGFHTSWECVPTDPIAPLCDGACETCTLAGCRSNCAACTKCQPGVGCSIDVTPPSSAIRWAKVTRTDGTGGTCSCVGQSCSCNGGGSVEVSFYGCKQAPTPPPLKGRCAAVSSGSANHFFPCVIPPACDPLFRIQLAWAAFNSCTQCTPGLEITCQQLSPNQVKGPQPFGHVLDLRTNDEKESGCCDSTPP